MVSTPTLPDSWKNWPAEAKRELKARLESELGRRWVNDPAGWVRGRLGEFLWSKQVDICESVLAHRRTAVKSCHGIGKSHTVSRLVCWWIDSHPPGSAFVVTTAPTAVQVSAILWRYIGQAHRKGNLPGRVLTTEWKFGSELVAYGRKPADHDQAAFNGIHAQYVLVVLDEAGGIPEQLWTAADSLTTNDGCALVAIGNPADAASHFARVCEPGSGWNTITISAFDSPNLTGEQVPAGVARQLVSRSWVEEKRAEWGEDSPLWAEKVLGEFPVDSDAKVVRASDLARCRQRADDRTTVDTPIVLGVDVGASLQGDFSVIRERVGTKAGRAWSFREPDLEVVADHCVMRINETGATRVHIDATGVGHGLVGMLNRRREQGAHSATVVGVMVGTAASEPARFKNLRAELWWMARELSRTGGWDLSSMDDQDVTCSQLAAPEWSPDAAGRIVVESKDELRKRIGRSTDDADALLLAFYMPHVARGPRMRFTPT